MNTINYIQLLFSSMVLIMILMSSLINSFEKYLPVFIRRSFRYGKFACNESDKFVMKTEIPKSWFRHFYVFSSFISVCALNCAIKVYLHNQSPPEWLERLLDNCFGVFRRGRVKPILVLLALILLTLQCLRRFYDTHFVSIFGKNSKINIPQYLCGYIHYGGAVLTILAEAPLFAISTEKTNVDVDDINIWHIFATLLFLWAWYHQHKVSVILASLRKNSAGKIITDSHIVPYGDWFEYVSSPHLLAEKLIYISLTIILWGNITWLFILAWVITNQVETALLSHWWYQSKFPEYPKQRKAIIPFVY